MNLADQMTFELAVLIVDGHFQPQDAVLLRLGSKMSTVAVQNIHD